MYALEQNEKGMKLLMKSYWIKSVDEKEVNKFESLQENIKTDIRGRVNLLNILTN